MSSVEPNQHGNQQHTSEKRAGELVEAGCDAAVVLDFVEEAFDDIALEIEGEVRLALGLPVGLRRNDGFDAAPFEVCDEGIGVVALVGENCLRLNLCEQRLGLRDVRRLPGVSDSATGLPCASTMAWILVINPPRERPIAWSAPSFF